MSMSFISQSIVYALALMGVLFKSTKTDANGKTEHTKYGLPVLTTTGKIVIILLTLSFLLSLVTSWQKEKSDTQQKDEAVARQKELSAQLDAVRQQNQGLRDGIGEIIKASATLSDEQKKNFNSVLTEQKQTGEGIANRIGSSADLLRSRIENTSNALRGRVDDTIGLLNFSTKQIERSIYPIKDVRVSYWVKVPLDHPSVAAYRKRLKEGVEAFLRSPNRDRPNPDIFVSGSVEGRGPTTVAIPLGSSLFPNRMSENVAYTVLTYTGIEIEFYKTRLDVQSYVNRAAQPDLLIPIFGDMDRPQGATVQLSYDIQTGEVSVGGIDLPADPRFWRNNTGNITAIPDLLGAQMLVRFRSVMTSELEGNREYVAEIHRRIEVQTVALSMSGGLEFWFRTDNPFKGGKLERYTDKSGLTFYLHDFPGSMKELTGASAK